MDGIGFSQAVPQSPRAPGSAVQAASVASFRSMQQAVPKTADFVMRPTAQQSVVTAKYAPLYSVTLNRLSIFNEHQFDPDFKETSWAVGKETDNEAVQYTPAIILDDDARFPGPGGMTQHLRFCSNGTHVSQYWDFKLGTRARFAGMVMAGRTEKEVLGTNHGSHTAMNYPTSGIHSMLPLLIKGTINFRNLGPSDCSVGDTLMWAPVPINGGTPAFTDGHSTTAYRFAFLPVPPNLETLLLLDDENHLADQRRRDPIFDYICKKTNNAEKAVQAYMRHVDRAIVGKCYESARPGKVGQIFVIPH